MTGVPSAADRSTPSVLVVGGAGFIGSHTVDALRSAGHAVRVLDSLQPPTHRGGAPADLAPEAELIRGDVRDKAVWQAALDGIEVVFHFAAYQDYLQDFSTFFAVNEVGTALLYEVMVERRLPVSKVVVASSQAVYGEGRHTCRTAGCPADGRVVWPDLRSQEQLARGTGTTAARPAGGQRNTPAGSVRSMAWKTRWTRLAARWRRRV